MYGNEFKGAKEKFLVTYNTNYGHPVIKANFLKNSIMFTKSFVVIKVTWDM